LRFRIRRPAGSAGIHSREQILQGFEYAGVYDVKGGNRTNLQYAAFLDPRSAPLIQS